MGLNEGVFVWEPHLVMLKGLLLALRTQGSLLVRYHSWPGSEYLLGYLGLNPGQP